MEILYADLVFVIGSVWAYQLLANFPHKASLKITRTVHLTDDNVTKMLLSLSMANNGAGT